MVGLDTYGAKSATEYRKLSEASEKLEDYADKGKVAKLLKKKVSARTAEERVIAQAFQKENITEFSNSGAIKKAIDKMTKALEDNKRNVQSANILRKFALNNTASGEKQ